MSNGSRPVDTRRMILEGFNPALSTESAYFRKEDFAKIARKAKPVRISEIVAMMSHVYAIHGPEAAETLANGGGYATGCADCDSLASAYRSKRDGDAK